MSIFINNKNQESNFPALLIDVGNSKIKWLIITREGIQLAAGSMSHKCKKNESKIFDTLQCPAAIWLSNVANKTINTRLKRLIDDCWPNNKLKIRQIFASSKYNGVYNGYYNPSKLGSDRWASLLGARAVFPKERLLIATFGTATTLELLEANGYFSGGVIAPGLTLMLTTLNKKITSLPIFKKSDINKKFKKTRCYSKIFVKDTTNSIIEGCRIAQAGLLEYAWQKAQSIKSDVTLPLRCILTGGAANKIKPILNIPFTYHNNLVLVGLYEIAKNTY